MVDLILLAAGASRRFGGDKLLATFEGRPLYEYAFEAAKQAQNQGARILLVARHPQLLKSGEKLGFLPLPMPEPTEGVAASIRRGVACCRQGANLCFFVCDEPHFSGETLCRFLQAFEESGKLLGRVCAGSVMGSPTIFSPLFKPQLMALQGDRGGRALFQGREEDTLFFQVPLQELADYDQPWDNTTP